MTHIFHEDYLRTGYCPQKLNKCEEDWCIEFSADIEEITPGKDGHLILSARDCTMLFDIDNQKVLWEHEGNTGDHSPVHIYNDEIIKAGNMGRYTIFNYNTGEAAKKHVYHRAEVAIYNNLLIRPGETSLQVVDLDKKHKRLYQLKLMGEIRGMGHPVINDGRAWFFQNEDTSGHRAGQYYLTGIHLDTGMQQLIPVETPYSEPVGYKDKLYFFTELGMCCVQHTGDTSYVPLGDLKLQRFSSIPKPVIKGDTMYFYLNDYNTRKILFLDLKTYKLQTLWEIDQKQYEHAISALYIMDDQLLLKSYNQLIIKNLNNEKTQAITYLEEDIRCITSNLVSVNGSLFMSLAGEKKEGLKQGNYNNSYLIKIG